jgi:hypothetical protein
MPEAGLWASNERRGLRKSKTQKNRIKTKKLKIRKRGDWWVVRY